MQMLRGTETVNKIYFQFTPEVNAFLSSLLFTFYGGETKREIPRAGGRRNPAVRSIDGVEHETQKEKSMS